MLLRLSAGGPPLVTIVPAMEKVHGIALGDVGEDFLCAAAQTVDDDATNVMVYAEFPCTQSRLPGTP